MYMYMCMYMPISMDMGMFNVRGRFMDVGMSLYMSMSMFICAYAVHEHMRCSTRTCQLYGLLAHAQLSATCTPPSDLLVNPSSRFSPNRYFNKFVSLIYTLLASIDVFSLPLETANADGESCP